MMNINDFEVAKQRIIQKISQTREKVRMLSQGNEDHMKQSKLQNPQNNPHSIILKNNYYSLGNSAGQNRMISKLQNQLIDNQYRVNALENFPFGKERAKMVNMISSHMNPKQDQLNKKMLNKFRIQAIQYRNNKLKRNFQVNNPYLSQSMMPTSNYEYLSNLNQDKKQRFNQPFVNKSYQISPERSHNVSSPITNFNNRMMTIPHNPIIYQQNNNLSRYKSIAVDTQFIQKIKQKEQKKVRIRELKILQKKRQEKRLNKIEIMIHDMNQQLRKNTQLINQRILGEKKTYQTKSAKNKLTKKNDQESVESQQQKIQEVQKSLNILPKVQYTNNNKANQAQLGTNNPSQIKNHLILLRKHRKRIDIE